MSTAVEEIGSSCSSLLEKIAATTVLVQESARRNRQARVDLGDLSRQLSDLSSVIDHLKYDSVQNEASKDAIGTVGPRLGRILGHCLDVMKDVDNFVSLAEGLEFWSDEMKVEIDNIYKLLDVYTLSLQVILDMLHLIADRQDIRGKIEGNESEVVPTIEGATSRIGDLRLASEPPDNSQRAPETPDARGSPGLGRKILRARSPRGSLSPASGLN